MKKGIITVAIVAITLSSCSKEQHNVTPASNQTAAVANNNNAPAGGVQTIQPHPADGLWAYAHDTARKFIVHIDGNGSATVTFLYKIETPHYYRPYDVQYQLSKYNGLEDLYYPGIYPCMRFNPDGSMGWAAEHLKVPGQGSYLPLVRLNN